MVSTVIKMHMDAHKQKTLNLRCDSIFFTKKIEAGEGFLLWLFSRPAAVSRPALCGSALPARPHCPAARGTENKAYLFDTVY